MAARRRAKVGPPALPRSFRAGGVRWTLTNSDVGWGRAVATVTIDGTESAVTAGSLHLVAIAPDLPRDVERVVVFHELVHVALVVAGWREDHIDAGDFEESIAHALTYVGLAILRDNPALRAYLFA